MILILAYLVNLEIEKLINVKIGSSFCYSCKKEYTHQNIYWNTINACWWHEHGCCKCLNGKYTNAMFFLNDKSYKPWQGSVWDGTGLESLIPPSQNRYYLQYQSSRNKRQETGAFVSKINAKFRDRNYTCPKGP